MGVDYLRVGLQGYVLIFVILAKVGTNMEGGRASLSESGFTGLAGFSGFRFAQLAVFATTEDSDKTNTDERLPLEDELAES